MKKYYSWILVASAVFLLFSLIGNHQQLNKTLDGVLGKYLYSLENKEEKIAPTYQATIEQYIYHPAGEAVTDFPNCDTLIAGTAVESSRSLPGWCGVNYYGHMQAVRGYAERFASEASSRLMFYLAARPNSEAINVTEANIVNAASGNIVKQIILDEELVVRPQVCRAFFGRGCDFSTKFSVDTSSLANGMYFLQLSNGRERAQIPFVIRDLVNTYDYALVFPTWTMHAYSSVGGSSMYYRVDSKKNYNLSPVVKGFKRVSLNRPFEDNTYYHSVQSLVDTYKYFESKDWNYVILSDLDMHEQKNLHQLARTVVFIGHNEYWTKERSKYMRDFVKKGGNVVNFSGNIQWYRVTLEKGEIFSYANGVKESEEEKFREDYPLFDPYSRYMNLPGEEPQSLVGVSYRYGGYSIADLARHIESLDLLESDKELTVVCDHPIFAHADLTRGDAFGGQQNILGVELDGLPLDENLQLDASSLPRDSKIRILATGHSATTSTWQRVPVRSRLNTALMVEYQSSPKSGRVVSLGSIGFIRAFMSEESKATAVFDGAMEYALALSSGEVEEESNCSWNRRLSNDVKDLGQRILDLFF